MKGQQYDHSFYDCNSRTLPSSPECLRGAVTNILFDHDIDPFFGLQENYLLDSSVNLPRAGNIEHWKHEIKAL